MFNFLNGSILNQDDFILEDRKAYIKDFLYSNSVTLIYSPPKQGKTWLGYGITTTLAKRDDIRAIIYVDMDNGLTSLNERSINNKLIPIPKVRYVSRAKIDCSPIEYLKRIDDEALRNNYHDVVFVLETTKDFIDTDSKSQSEDFMKIVMRMRDAGATVIIMHHATKTGKTISGVQVFINSPDNVYEMTQKAKETDKLQSAYEKMFVEVDKYIKWFSDVPVAAINPKRDTFNNLFTMVQHLNKITPSLPLDMLKNNQLIVDSILSSIDFKEEVIRAYKEVMAENK